MNNKLVKERLIAIINKKRITDISSIKVIGSVLAVLTENYFENTNKSAVSLMLFYKTTPYFTQINLNLR